MKERTVILLEREHRAIEICETTVLTRISEGIEIVYQYGEGDNKIVFTSADRARVGDQIVFNSGRWVLVPKTRFEQRFAEAPEGMIIEVSSDNRYVLISFEPKNGKGELRQIVSAGQDDSGEWRIRYADDIADLSFVEAARIIAAYNALVRKVREIIIGI